MVLRILDAEQVCQTFIAVLQKEMIIIPSG